MKFREIKQHHIPAIISISVLFIMDSLAFYCAYLLTENMGSEFVSIKYPFRVFIVIIFLIYISKRYNPSPTVSRTHETKTIIQLIYLIGIAQDQNELSRVVAHANGINRVINVINHVKLKKKAYEES